MWRGHARIGQGYAVFVGSTGDNAEHAHHAVQLAVAIGAPFTLWTHRSGRISGAVALVGVDEPHLLLPSIDPIALLYVEGESVAGRGLNAIARESAPGMLDAHAQMLGDIIERSTGPEVVEQVMTTLGRPISLAQDTLLSVLIDSLTPEELETLTMPTLAQRLGMSPSRFMHRFRALTGMAVRPYLRWRRLQLAVGFALEGADLTDAAHRAGFSDAAHFSRTFREHFGLSPSSLLAAMRA